MSTLRIFHKPIQSHLLTSTLLNGYIRISVEQLDKINTPQQLKIAQFSQGDLGISFYDYKPYQKIVNVFEALQSLNGYNFKIGKRSLEITFLMGLEGERDSKTIRRVQLPFTRYVLVKRDEPLDANQKIVYEPQKTFEISQKDDTFRLSDMETPQKLNNNYLSRNSLLKNSFISYEESTEQQQFIWDYKTQFAKCFDIDSKTITRNSILKKGGWYQVTSTNPLKYIVGKQNKLKIKFEQYGDKESQIVIGIIKQSRKQKQFSGWQGINDSIGFTSNNKIKKGCICVAGEKKIEEKELFVGEGEELEIKMDFKDWKVTFTKLGKMQSWSYEVGDSFKKEKLYVFAVMGYVKDRVEVLQ